MHCLLGEMGHGVFLGFFFWGVGGKFSAEQGGVHTNDVKGNESACSSFS